MAFSHKVEIIFEGTPQQWKAVYDDLGGLTATGPSLYVARRIRQAVRASLIETRRNRVNSRETVADAAAELTEIDQDISDIDTDLIDYPEV
jgi:hypothetical protein